jgi:adenylate cyclase
MGVESSQFGRYGVSLHFDESIRDSRSFCETFTAMFGQLISITGWPTIPLEKKCLLVGRRLSCEVHLPNMTVSARHCELALTNDYWFVRDLESRNGTYVNGKRVSQSRLEAGDLIAFGKRNVFVIQYSTPTTTGRLWLPPQLGQPCAAFHRSVIAGICPWCGQPVFIG